MPLQKPDSISQVINKNRIEISKIWVAHLMSVPGNRMGEVMSQRELMKQANELLDKLIPALKTENYVAIDDPDYEEVISYLKEISVSRAEKGFTPTEVAMFVLSIKGATLPFMAEGFKSESGQVPKEIASFNHLIDKLALVTFETFVDARETVVREQASSILELSTPVIVIFDGIMLLPLVGTIDTMRAQQMTENLLEAVVKYQARVVVIDVTGVAVIDTSVAQNFINTVKAVRMLGAEVIFTGINPDAAMTMVGLGIDLSDTLTRGNLRAGMEFALGILGKEVTEKPVGDL